jgi:hypothetical protein
MTITVQLTPEIEARLVARARDRGMSLSALVQSMIERIAGERKERKIALEAFDAALDELAEGSENLPVLSPQAYRREGIYGDG